MSAKSSVDKKKVVLDRPAPRGFSQTIRRGTRELLGAPVGEQVDAPKAKATEQGTTKKRAKKPTAKKPAKRKAFTVNYLEDDLDRLEKLWLAERANRKGLRKTTLLDEAMQLLFQSYERRQG